MQFPVFGIDEGYEFGLHERLILNIVENLESAISLNKLSENYKDNRSVCVKFSLTRKNRRITVNFCFTIRFGIYCHIISTILSG